MDSPLITIAIPVHNRADLVERTLRSIEAQTYRPFKLILVDNASSDDTLRVLTDWRDRHTSPTLQISVISESTPGAPAARNAALALVDTPWTMFFDSDDTMRPTHLQSVIDVIKAQPDTDIIGWDVNLRFIDGSESAKPFITDDIVYNCIMHGTFATQRYTCRTDIFREAGGWDNTVPVWNDIELGTRILSLPRHLKVTKIHGEPHVDVYQTAESITGLTFHGNGTGREHAMACMHNTLPDSKKDIITLKMAILAAHYAREGYADDASRLLAHALSLSSSVPRRLVLRLAYHYTRRGLRGIAKILRPIYS